MALNLKGLKKIRDRLQTVVGVALITTAQKIAVEAAENAEKDTEFLAESIHVVALDYSEHDIAYASSMSKFQAAVKVGKTPKGVRVNENSRYLFFPEERPSDSNEVWVVVGAEHGINNEMGIDGRKPFLMPAVYANRGFLTNQIRRSIEGLSVKAIIEKGEE